MKSSSYDTRFLIELFHSTSSERQKKIRDILRESRPGIVSVIALSELYELTLRRAGREVADTQLRVLERDFRLIGVDEAIAIEAARIRRQHKRPLADSLIAATAKLLDVPCYTDDAHFHAIKGLLVKWID